MEIKRNTNADKEIFDSEFSAANIPFKEVLKSDNFYCDALFNEYNLTELKPSFSLYLENFFSKAELNEGIEEMHRQVPVSNSKDVIAANFVNLTPFEEKFREIYSDYITKVAKNLMPLEYFCPDIEKTLIVRKLKEISSVFDILKESVFDNETNKYMEPAIRAESIILLAKEINNDILAKDILNSLVNTNDNFLLFRKKNDSENKESDKWKAIKIDFNRLLINAIQNKFNNMDFYHDIAHRLYVWNTKIGETNFRDPFEFIEAKHSEAPFKGKIFYENLIQRLPDHFGAKMRPDFFNEILNYCGQKIEEIKKAAISQKPVNESDLLKIENSQTKNIILKEFESLDHTLGWKYAFSNEHDFKIFLDLLTNFFEYKHYSIPQEVIRLKKDCKTRFAKSLRPIHKDLSENQLKSDIEFFKLIRVLNHFEKLTDIQIYNAITR